MSRPVKQPASPRGKRPLQIKASSVVPTEKITVQRTKPRSTSYFSAATENWKKGIMCYYLNESLLGVLANFPLLIFSPEGWQVMGCSFMKLNQGNWGFSATASLWPSPFLSIFAFSYFFIFLKRILHLFMCPLCVCYVFLLLVVVYVCS